MQDDTLDRARSRSTHGPGGEDSLRRGTEPGVHRREATAFLMRLGRALHSYGTPSHRLEEALMRIAERLGLEGQFLVTPTSILASFGSLDRQQIRLVRVDAGETDLKKLTQLHHVIRDVFAGTLPPSKAARVVDEIVAAPPGYGRALTVLGFGLASGSAARVFDGGWPEITVAGSLGLVIGALMVLGDRFARVARLLPALSALLAASVAGLTSTRIDLFVPIVTLASLIVLVPGLTLTVAMSELASGHLVSGSARLTGAISTFLQLGFGAALGGRIAQTTVGTGAGSAPRELAEWTVLIALLVSASALAVLFRARLRDIPVILPMIAVAYGGARLGTLGLGPELGVALGALLLGVASNLVSRWRDQPTAIALMPALLLLVPGSLGFRSLQSLIEADVLTGVQSAFTMAMIAVALVTGLFVANVLVVPRRLL